MEWNSIHGRGSLNHIISNKIIIHPSFNETIKELRERKIKIPEFGTEENWDFSLIPFPKNGKVVTNVDEIKPIKLDAAKGQRLSSSEYLIVGYDESIQNFLALEGTAYIFSHSLVIHGENDFIPSVLVSCYFYTRSKLISQNSQYIKESDSPSVDSKRDYASDRTNFILDIVPSNSVILIDGPLIGGQISHITVKLNQQLLKKNVIPIFIVKNSGSNLITDNIIKFKGKFHSDMHWSYTTLKPGERTNFFRYVDKHNTKNGKVFCYLKTFNVSPQRVEFHIETYVKYKKIMNELMDLIYYLNLVQGDLKNPQVRTIAIAEKFARASLQLFNLQHLMKQIGLKPTMNETRGMK